MRSNPVSLVAWIVTAGVVTGFALWMVRIERVAANRDVTLFSAAQRGIPIVVPRAPLEQESCAAEMLQATFARAAGRAETNFPIVRATIPVPRHAVFVGRTRRSAGFLSPARKAPYDIRVGFMARGGALAIRSEHPESIESAAAWFLEKELGARWFMPGPLGEDVPRRDALVLTARTEVTEPGFVHRDLGIPGEEGRKWYGRNRLQARFEHHHNLGNIFKPEDLRRTPEMAPMRLGQRYIPATAGAQNFQPNLLNDAAARHAANVAREAFQADPRRLSFSLSTNDEYRYDDSDETLAAVSPPRFFRHRPDYSAPVFQFTNRVAQLVASTHPDRYLPAYAYYWCENTPGFPIERNVVPFLTADRSQWSHPEFAAEDRALIERWCRSGAEFVGVYDYFYGMPFFVPRPTLYAIGESIPFHHRAGVRAFYAETYPNWALDGPKPWLAAQLLWSPARDPAELLEIYYRQFWAEASVPMREFFAICEKVWRAQPGPALWLRFFKDEDQSFIYSAEELRALRACIEEARRLAVSDVGRKRAALVSDGFSVSEAYAAFCTARRHVIQMTQLPGADPIALVSAWKAYRRARTDFVRRHADLRRDQPLALNDQDLQPYLRNEPDGRVVRELSRTDAGRAQLLTTEFLAEVYLSATAAELSDLFQRGRESLADPAWEEVRMRAVGSSAAIDWTEPGIWRGNGEPWEGRVVAMDSPSSGKRVLRIASARTEQIGQWTLVTPGALYAAQIDVRAKVSPGTATILIVNFLDANQRHLGTGRSDRLAADSAEQKTSLCVVVRAPPNARFIGFGLCAWNQINDDFVEFSGASLRRLHRREE